MSTRLRDENSREASLWEAPQIIFVSFTSILSRGSNSPREEKSPQASGWRLGESNHFRIGENILIYLTKPDFNRNCFTRA